MRRFVWLLCKLFASDLAQRSVDAVLPARPAFLEEIQHIAVDAQRHHFLCTGDARRLRRQVRRFRCHGLEGALGRLAGIDRVLAHDTPSITHPSWPHAASGCEAAAEGAAPDIDGALACVQGPVAFANESRWTFAFPVECGRRQPRQPSLPVCPKLNPSAPAQVYFGSRSTSSIDMPCGPRRKQILMPGRGECGSLVNSTPFFFRSAAMESMPETARPKWSRP